MPRYDFPMVIVEGIDQSADMIVRAEARGYTGVVQSNLLDSTHWLAALKSGPVDAFVMNMVSYFFKADELVKIFTAAGTKLKSGWELCGLFFGRGYGW